ncbi:protein FAM71B-like [Terrapene carolina triunguis]|uniref:protein FAM71B-like n=1 Tax=Terrapene triunguis TaxID=2587831 RepID=UPI001156AB1A|nr:protein FAM71B-like [Terrapene carolina triunguis]
MAGCRRFPVTSGCRTFLADDPASGVHLGVEGGILCQLLRSPDYNLFPKSAVFESNFIQVTKQGNWVDILNAPTLVTLGVTSSEPCLPLPNVLLIARLAELGESPPGRAGQPQEPSMALSSMLTAVPWQVLSGAGVALLLPDPVHTPEPAAHSCPWGLGHPVLSLGSRLLPLRYVRLSVQDSARRLLRVQVVTGKVYYLRLHQAHPDAVFTLWSRLADILQWGLSITTKDPSIHVPHSLVLSVGSSSTSSSAQVHRPGARTRGPGCSGGPSASPRAGGCPGAPSPSPCSVGPVGDLGVESGVEAGVGDIPVHPFGDPQGQLVPDSQPPSGASRSMVPRMGKLLSGPLSHLSGAGLGKMEKDGSVQRRHPTPDLTQDRTLWRHVTLLEASGSYHTPSQKEAVEECRMSDTGGKLAVCERCRRDRPSDTGEKASLRTALRWLDTKCHGLWERDTPAGLLPLSRLSSLVAAGRQ